MSMFRILIADDSQEWRDLISLLLVKDTRFEIVGEARDGSQALELAAQTNPELILLDVDMPRLNGLDVARQILTRQPNTRIVFVTGQTDHDFVKAALDIGALGYVFKVSVNKDLPIAIDAAINGAAFVSDRLFCDRSTEEQSAEYNDESQVLKADSTFVIKFIYAQTWN